MRINDTRAIAWHNIGRQNGLWWRRAWLRLWDDVACVWRW